MPKEATKKNSRESKGSPPITKGTKESKTTAGEDDMGNLVRPVDIDLYRGKRLPEEAVDHFKLKIYVCEMHTDMLKMALTIVVTCLENNFSTADTAQELKQCFDSACPLAPWHCIVGKAFYSICTHCNSYYCFFRIDDLKVLLYRCLEPQSQ